MLKKTIFSLSLLSLVFAPSSWALGIVPGSNTTNDQYYTVVFDGEGEAAVVARIDLTNNTKSSIDQVNLNVPAKSLRIINAAQSYRGYINDYPTGRPEIYPNYHYGGYYSLDSKQISNADGFSVKLTLVNSLSSQESTTILLYYKATGYVNNILGLRNFGFQTIKTDFDVDTVRVAVNAQEPFNVKGAKASTNYQPNFAPISEGKSFSGADDASLGALSTQIQTEEGFVKQTQSLDPGENFVVKGSYAESVVLLYLPDLVGWLIGAVIVLGVFWLVYRWWKRKHIVLNQFSQINPLIKTIAISIASTTLLIVSSFLGLLLIEKFSSQGQNPFLVLLVLLIMFVLATLFIFGPAVYFGIKYGIKYGVFAIAISVVFLIVALVFLLLFLNVTNNRIYPTTEVIY